MPSNISPVVTRRQSVMSSLRANATIIVLRVLPRPSAVRVSNAANYFNDLQKLNLRFAGASALHSVLYPPRANRGGSPCFVR